MCNYDLQSPLHASDKALKAVFNYTAVQGEYSDMYPLVVGDNHRIDSP